MLPTPVNLSSDLVRCWRDYEEEGLPWRRRVAFCLLRLGQRLAYWLGWTMGARSRRSR